MASVATAVAMVLLHSAVSFKPHVVFFLADDHGWSDLGAHRAAGESAEEVQAQTETHTPNLDSLVREGVLLERHYAYRTCSPSRSSLQSGRLPVHVNVLDSTSLNWNPSDNISGFAGIPPGMTGIAEKMKQGGYATHMVGKWHVGMATPSHTPLGKGYDSWLGYLQFSNDYWHQNSPSGVDFCVKKFLDFSLYNATYRAGANEAIAAELGCNVRAQHGQKIEVNATGCNLADPSHCLPSGCYEESMLNEYALKIIRAHDKSLPLFLFYAFHLVHSPMQVPSSYLQQIDDIVAQSAVPRPIPWTENRRLHAAMNLYMDTMVGRVVSALKEQQMYQDTLMIFVSDNGGSVPEPDSGNNWPLKGGKYSDWDGGVRTNALVSGGFVPPARRGSKFDGIISVADWYATLSTLAGVSIRDAKAEMVNRYLEENGLPLLPPVDGRPQWENILSGAKGRRDPLHLSETALLWWPMKLVTGMQSFSFHPGPVYPNCTTVSGLDYGPIRPRTQISAFGLSVKIANETQQEELTFASDCGAGCLYNVEQDPSESQDLSREGIYADTLVAMQEKLRDLNRGNFNPNRGGEAVEACLQACALGGVYGPFVDADGFYLGVNLTKAAEESTTAVQLLELNQTADQVRRKAQLQRNASEAQAEVLRFITNAAETYGFIIEPPPTSDTCLASTAAATDRAEEPVVPPTRLRQRGSSWGLRRNRLSEPAKLLAEEGVSEATVHFVQLDKSIGHEDL